jgi:uncharacterized protein (TIGR02145 family)
MKKTLTTIFLCAAIGIWFAGCKDDNPEPKAELLVSPATLSASAEAGEYALAVTGNVDWAAATDAEWLAIAPATGTGDGTLAVTVAENPRAEPRTATVTLTSGELNNAAIVMQEARPFYAASTQTWTVGDQTWSDVIQVPECNKEEYPIDPYTPHCRKVSDQLGTTYLYNWAYVNLNAAQVCPAPWRVPTSMDFMNLDMTLGGSGDNRADENTNWVREQYLGTWGGIFGGFINSYGTLANREGAGYYWSSTSSSGISAYGLAFVVTGVVYPKVNSMKEYGIALRCVK